MKKNTLEKIFLVVVILLITTLAYATAIKEIVHHETTDTVWALIVNGVISLIGFGGWTWGGSQFMRYYKENNENQKKVNKELIIAKNDQAKDIVILKTHFEDCIYCNRKGKYPD